MIRAIVSLICLTCGIASSAGVVEGITKAKHALLNPQVIEGYSEPAVVHYLQYSIESMNPDDLNQLAYAMAENDITEVRISNHYEVYESTMSKLMRSIFGARANYVLNLAAGEKEDVDTMLPQLRWGLQARHEIMGMLPGVQVGFALEHIKFDFQKIQELIRQNVPAISRKLVNNKVRYLEFTDTTRLIGSPSDSWQILKVRAISDDHQFDIQPVSEALLK